MNRVNLSILITDLRITVTRPILNSSVTLGEKGLTRNPLML